MAAVNSSSSHAPSRSQKLSASIGLPRIGPELFENIWQKVRATLQVTDRYVVNPSSLHAPSGLAGEYDWVFVSGDDTYVHMDNLRALLSSPEVVRTLHGRGERARCKAARPVYLGQVTSNGIPLLFIQSHFISRPGVTTLL
jgi:hypothetical protein